MIKERLGVVQQQIDWIRNSDPSKGSAVGKAHDLERLEERIRRLSGTAAVIRIGGRNDTIIKERLQRFENALNSIRGAMSEGVLPGGGAGLLRARKALKALPRQDVRRAMRNRCRSRRAIGEPVRLISRQRWARTRAT